MSTSEMPWLDVWCCLSYSMGENSPYFPGHKQRGLGSIAQDEPTLDGREHLELGEYMEFWLLGLLMYFTGIIFGCYLGM